MGSEMCIRDRFKNWSGFFLNEEKNLKSNRHPCEDQLKSEENSGCPMVLALISMSVELSVQSKLLLQWCRLPKAHPHCRRSKDSQKMSDIPAQEDEANDFLSIDNQTIVSKIQK